MKKILELFSGTQSISKVFRANGWDTYTIDNDLYFSDFTSCVKDILQVTSADILQHFGQPRVIWASPPCQAFSVAAIGKHWGGGFRGYEPKTEKAITSQLLVLHTLKLIEELQPVYFFIENPMGLLRKMPFMQHLNRHTVAYCQYGDSRQKPTDLWTNHPAPNFKPMCKRGSPCHAAAPRGSKGGTQGMANARLKAVIPPLLCEHIFKIVNEN